MNRPTTQTPSSWLRIARAALIAFAAFLLILLVVGVVLFPDYSSQHYLESTPNNFWTGEQTQSALDELNLPATTLVWYWFGIEILMILISMSIVLFLLWRKSGDWFGLYLTFAFLIVSPGSTLIEPVIAFVSALASMFELLGTIGWQLTFILFYLFPDGRFVPRWTRWMPLVWLGVNIPTWLISFDILQSSWGLWVGIGLVITAIGSQIYRYFWRSTPLQRQQTKWVVAFLGVFFLLMLFLAPNIFKPPPENALGVSLLWAVFGGTLFQMVFILILVVILLAVLRYRLWDIDVIIRRTLVYGLLSVLLGLVYFGSVIVLQRLFEAVSGQESPIAVVMSTLMSAALFNPLRRRIQNNIDRRFFRKKYDAEVALQAFGAHLREQLELEELSERLLAMVEETMQPASISLWISKPPDKGEGSGL